MCVERSPLKVRSLPIPSPAQRGKRLLDLWSGFIGREITSGGEKGWVAINLHILWGRKVKRGISRLFTLSFGQRPEAEAVAVMKPQNFLLENLKFANVEEFSKKRLEIVAVEDFFFGNIGNCGCGRNFQRKDRKSWMWKIFSKKR